MLTIFHLHKLHRFEDHDSPHDANHHDDNAHGVHPHDDNAHGVQPHDDNPHDDYPHEVGVGDNLLMAGAT